MKTNLIGVLLPVYKNDSPRYLRETLESVLKQTYSNFIVLIGVDGPVEGALNILLNSYSTNSKVRINYFEQNRGLAAVLNDLLDKAKSYECDYYARIDADDICVIDRFQKQVDFLKENKNIDVVGGAIEEIDDNGNKNGKKVVYPSNHEECRSFFRFRDPLAHPAVMFSKSFFENVEGYRVEYRKNQDTMLWFDGFLHGCIFANLKETVIYFRVTNDFYDNRRSGWNRAKKMFKDRLMINKKLNFGFKAYVFALLSFVLTISPSFLKRIAYKFR